MNITEKLGRVIFSVIDSMCHTKANQTASWSPRYLRDFLGGVCSAVFILVVFWLIFGGPK